jgi:hypothetical protein
LKTGCEPQAQSKALASSNNILGMVVLVSGSQSGSVTSSAVIPRCTWQNFAAEQIVKTDSAVTRKITVKLQTRWYLAACGNY